MAARLRDIPDEEEAARSVAEYLRHVQRDYMADAPDERAAWRIDSLAAALVAWHTWSFKHRGAPPSDWLPD